MASENYVQPSIPRFDGHHYDHWSMLMENFLQSKEYWTVVEAGVPELAAGANDAQRAEIEKEKLKDLKANNYLFQAIDQAILETILNKSTSKNIWDSMKKKYQGNERARRQQRQALRAEFEVLQMQIGESVDDYFARMMAIANKMRIHGENLEDVAIVEKILRSMTTKFNYVVCSIEGSNDIETLSLDELQNSLLIHERKINRQDKQEQAMQISQTQALQTTVNSRAIGRGKENWKGRPRSGRPKSDRLEEKHNEKNDDSSLFMVCHPKEVSKKNVWYLDTGCSNHMCGDKSAFSDLDESCQDKVKFGDNSTITVKGRGKVKMMGNRLFPLYLQTTNLSCLSARLKDTAWLWHCRFGHLYFGGLKALQQKKMVNGLPHFDSPSKICEICVVSKQHRDSFPKDRSWRAKQVLNLVHSDLCGPIHPMENGVCERRNRTIMNMVRSLMSKSGLPKEFWPEAVNWSFHILNRCPTSPLPDLTPEEAWGGCRPVVDYFRIFGDQSKAYRLYNPLTKKVIISRDVVFDEASTWSWTKKSGQQIPADFENGEDLTMQNSEGQTLADLEVSRQTAEEILPTEVEFSIGGSLPTTPELESGTSSKPQCKKRRPAWLEDYEVTNLPQDDVPVNHFALFVDCDPLTYEEAIKEEKWQKAMTKLKENGAVDKFKARLVAKGYKQEFGIDYQEVFAPVARMDTIRLVIALAAQNSWPIYQLDVKSALLHGNLQEQMFIDQPPGYVKSGAKHKEVLDRFQMKNCNSVTTPVDKGVKLVKDPGGRFVDNKLYKQIVGSLMYLTATKPDIMHGVNFGLFYKKGDQTDLAGFTNSDYARDLDDRKSTSGFVFMLGSGAISWSSKKQPIVTLSTTEAEYVAATSCACQAIWLRRIMEELELNQHEATSIYCDNSSAIKLSKNPVLHGRSKHIHVSFHLLPPTVLSSGAFVPGTGFVPPSSSHPFLLASINRLTQRNLLMAGASNSPKKVTIWVLRDFDFYVMGCLIGMESDEEIRRVPELGGKVAGASVAGRDGSSSTIATITSILSPRIFTIPLLSISSSSQPPPSSPVITKAEGFDSYQKWGEDEADLAGNHGSKAFTESPTHRRQVEEDVRGMRRVAFVVLDEEREQK
ncbi:hypothetical protein SLEP1_g58452 [Rubroshorea leprosula]|uniref:Integrase catalytic domain-containing protein n=1 Tax=Rubroshorea leprosula TaxID=152421 RepID=A0AAV5MSM0_9ROSI|nr:hypothetical protein SLEP1_g58452 [Rubroshorea leprosula]